MTIMEYIIEAKSKGYKVYLPNGLTDTSYFYYTDNENNIGYCQFNKYDGLSFSTVHKPNILTGTGYKVDSFEEGLLYKPQWANNASSVIKYKSIDDYIKNSWQVLIEYK